jgi:hypothetical protein
VVTFKEVLSPATHLEIVVGTEFDDGDDDGEDGGEDGGWKKKSVRRR